MKNEYWTQKFLQTFPNLIELSITFEEWERSTINIIRPLFWPHLKVLLLDELWSSESEILEVLEKHQVLLEKIVLDNITLNQGSWQSLFSKFRELNSSTIIEPKGELFECGSNRILYMKDESKDLLVNFLTQYNTPWPF